MTAYYGGRAECRIRRVSVPVVYLDFLSMYPTVNALMGLWRHVTAARIEVKNATDEIRALVERVQAADCLDPALWPELPALVQIKSGGGVLPVRARYGNGRSWGIGSNPLHSDEPLWYALSGRDCLKAHHRTSPRDHPSIATRARRPPAWPQVHATPRRRWTSTHANTTCSGRRSSGADSSGQRRAHSAGSSRRSPTAPATASTPR